MPCPAPAPAKERQAPRRPRVSIGLPVYNGENYLRAAIDSLLQQTFRDFELILCDNASTDSTGAICRDYAARDPRVRYDRHPKNIGAGRNFNHAVALARGDYFKWAAHDDLCAPDLLEQCVATLDDHPDAVLVFPRARVIDDASTPGEVYNDPLPTDDADPAVRFGALMGGHPCYQVFGLIRLPALRTTTLIGLYANGDGVLLCQLALRGRFIKLPDPLFFPRQHPQQSMAMVGNHRAYAHWFDPRLRSRLLFPWWRRYWELFRSIFGYRLGFATRVRCLGHWARWVYMRKTCLLRDVAFNVRLAVNGGR